MTQKETVAVGFNGTSELIWAQVAHVTRLANKESARGKAKTSHSHLPGGYKGEVIKPPDRDMFHNL